MTFDCSNALCSGQGFFLPNLVAIGHFWAIWPLIDPRGHSPEKRGAGMWSRKTPFHASPAVQKTHRWGTSPFTRPSFKENVTFCLQNQTFSENIPFFSTRRSNLAAVFVKKFENLVKYQFSSPCFLMKIRSQDPTLTAIYLLTRPQVRKSRLCIPTRKKNMLF